MDVHAATKANLKDPLPLAKDLIRCPSITPEDAGALGVLEKALKSLGFECHRLPFSEKGYAKVDNLYARFGNEGANFCFAGHTDVVPIGDLKDWTVDPFEAKVIDGMLIGRGACDMKGGIAAFVAAVARYLSENQGTFGGSLSLLITGDEEGPAINGTQKVLRRLKKMGETLDSCLVGEPSCPNVLGDTVKIGRRGSMNVTLVIEGTQGHTAYPHLANNPTHHLIRILEGLIRLPLDFGSDHFEPSTLQVSSIDVGNPATNVIPARAEAKLNVRFNDLHSGADIEKHIRGVAAGVLQDAGDAVFSMESFISGESFVCPPGPFTSVIQEAVQTVTGIEPVLNTGGGTSDARFIHQYCPVAEFGLVNKTIHKVDEAVSLDDLETLTKIYHKVLDTYFQNSPKGG